MTIDILEKLVNIPSYVDSNNNEIALGNYIVDFLTKNTNLKVKKQPVEKGRFNIIAYKTNKPKYILFGHMDTVPPKVETTNPFKATQKNGNLYGLGAVDMKAGLAIMLDLAVKFKDQDNVAYIFTVDEEYEFKGAFKLVKEYSFKNSILINVEPTTLKIVNGCRGVTEFSFNVHGVSCHAGSKHLGINAIEKTVELFNMLQIELSKYDTDGLNNSLNLAHLKGGILNNDQQVTYSGNVVPNYAHCVGEIRLASKKISEEKITKLIDKCSKRLKVTYSDLKFKFHLGSMYTPKEKLKDFEKSVKANKLKVEYANINTSGYFEVQLLQENWDSQVIMFGPGPLAMAHSKNEYVEIKSVIAAEKVIEHYIKK